MVRCAGGGRGILYGLSTPLRASRFEPLEPRPRPKKLLLQPVGVSCTRTGRVRGPRGSTSCT